MTTRSWMGVRALTKADVLTLARVLRGRGRGREAVALRKWASRIRAPLRGTCLTDLGSTSIREIVGCALLHGLKLGGVYVGAEHLLLGILEEKQGLARRVFQRSGIRLRLIRSMVLANLTQLPTNTPIMRSVPFTVHASRIVDSALCQARKFRQRVDGRHLLLSLLRHQGIPRHVLAAHLGLRPAAVLPLLAPGTSRAPV